MERKIEVEVFGELVIKDDQVKIKVEVIDKTENYNQVLKTYYRTYWGESKAKSVLKSIAGKMYQKGYEIYNIKGFGY
jgi:hypothetical protein